jgi:DNA-binding transcriptional ArsR family regulator
MVEYTFQLNNIFGALSDPIRRDILATVAKREHSVGELVANYHVSFAAISKHLKVMERAKLIIKRKEGKKHMVALAPDALKSADDYLEQYRQAWEERFNKLDSLLKEEE